MKKRILSRIFSTPRPVKKLKSIGREGDAPPKYRDLLTGDFNKDREVISRIEKNEADYTRGMLSHNLEEESYVLSQYLIERYTNPPQMPIDWIEYAFYRLGDLKGKRVCDFGCGHGEYSVYLAKKGAWVNAFDISDVAIELTRRHAEANGVKEQVKAEVKSAYKTGYPSDYFDVVFIEGALHHLDIGYGTKEIIRILKPGGKVVFLEPIIQSKAIEFIKFKLLRRWLRFQTASKFERSLTLQEVKQIGEHFSSFDYKRFRLFARASEKFHNYRPKLILSYLDFLVFKCLPFMEHYASAVVAVGIK